MGAGAPLFPIASSGQDAASQSASKPTSDGQKATAGISWLKGKMGLRPGFLTEKKYVQGKQPEGLDAIGNGLIYPQLVEKLKGSRISFNDVKLIMTTADGNGKSIEFKVIEAPDASSVTLKHSDGEVTTYHKEGERFWMASTGNVNIPLYFKRPPTNGD
jgi:hypothetical protein